jgi:GTPase SAR1 family protein
MKITESSNDQLRIRPFDNQNKKSTELHPDLPQPPFSLMLVGPKNSGKSSAILRLLYGNRRPRGCANNPSNTHHKFYRHWFDKIYIFSPTWELDPKTARCHIPPDQIFDEPHLYTEVIGQLLSGQEEDIEEEGKTDADKVLMVFSDLAGQKGVFTSQKGIMNKLAFNHRHYNVSIIIDTQALRQVNSAFRSNLSGIMLFEGISNRIELKKIYDEYLGRFNKHEATQLINYVFDTPYNFMFINFQKPKHRQFFKNFNPLKVEGADMG